MFGKVTATFPGKQYVEVEITTETVPETMPLTTADIDNLGGNLALCPGSSLLATSTKQVFVLNENEGWDELS